MDRERFCSGVDCLMYDSTVSGLPSESSVPGGPGLLDGEGPGVTVVGTEVGHENSGVSVSKGGRDTGITDIQAAEREN